MLHTPMEVPDQFPVRKTKKQKQEFRDAVCTYASSLGYPAAVEMGRFGSRNVVMGDPEAAKFLVTAHYDTPARMIVPNFCTPCNVFGYWLHKMGMWIAIALISALSGSLAGTMAGQWAIAPVSVLAVLLVMGLMLFGPANPSNVNDNTSGVVTVLEIMRTLPVNQRKQACFVLFDLEEAGFIGSGSYRAAHKKATENQLVLNLDCVGDGDHLLMIPTKKLKQDRKKLTSLYKACGYFGKKSLLVHEKGFASYNSDQKKFPLAVGICALKKSKFGLYLGRIHTPKDTVLEITNVNILRSALTTYMTCGQE